MATTPEIDTQPKSTEPKPQRPAQQPQRQEAEGSPPRPSKEALRALVVSDGEPTPVTAARASNGALAGKYRVTHGSLCLGHTEDGETHYVTRGAVVTLDGDSAARMLSEKTVERVAA